ncbi:hypothetical protein Avbf_03149, partial [Armadillidium vulgare]
LCGLNIYLALDLQYRRIWTGSLFSIDMLTNGFPMLFYITWTFHNGCHSILHMVYGMVDFSKSI